MLWLLVACAPTAPTEPADCTRPWVLGSARTDCQTEVAIRMFPAHAAEGVAYVDEVFSDQLHKDFVYLQVTMRTDPSGKYCARIQDEALKGRCEERARRPHLNRGLPGQGPPGGPPPGAPGAAPGAAAGAAPGAAGSATPPQP